MSAWSRSGPLTARRTAEPYDVLVISTGVANGFWRTPVVQGDDEIAQGLDTAHRQLAEAGSVMVIGGGAAAVSTAWNVAATWPDKRVDLYFPGADALPHHHPRAWRTLRRRFETRGVGLHSGHRAVVPDGFRGDQITRGPVAWSTGQPESSADAVIWAIGRVSPNTAWVPAELRNSDGFVTVDEYLRVPGAAGVYAVGDVAATDPLRTSARARADRLLVTEHPGRPRPRLAEAIQAAVATLGLSSRGPEQPARGVQPSGSAWTIPAWETLRPWLVNRAIYKGIRSDDG